MTYAITPRQVRYIQTMRRRLFGADDAAYRELLRGQARVASCKELKGAQIEVVIKHLESSLGIGKAGVRKRRKTEDRGPEQDFTGLPSPVSRPLRATAAQLDEIRRRWDGLSLAQPWEREGALRQFLKRRFHVNSPEWLTLAEAQKVLNGLKAMAGRGPKGPGTGDRGRAQGGSDG